LRFLGQVAIFGVYLVCTKRKSALLCASPYAMVGRARFELATNGLKVKNKVFFIYKTIA